VGVWIAAASPWKSGQRKQLEAVESSLETPLSILLLQVGMAACTAYPSSWSQNDALFGPSVADLAPPGLANRSSLQPNMAATIRPMVIGLCTTPDRWPPLRGGRHRP